MTTRTAAGVRRAPGSWPRFLGALTALVAIAAGLPLALIAGSQLVLGHWHPLPGIGPWDEIRRWLDQELASSQVTTVVMRVLLVVGWLLWLALLTSVLSTIAATRPANRRPRIPRLPAFDGIGAWIVAGLTALSSLTPNVAYTAPTATPIVAEATPPTIESPTVAPLITSPRAGWARVQSGESIEMFAARALGDPSRWQEVWSLNRGRNMDVAGTTWNEPWRLQPGWDLELPVAPAASGLHLVETAAETAPAAPSSPAASVTPADADDPHVYVVEPGDSYWAIAEQTLRVDTGREPTDAEVLHRTEDLIGRNGHRLGEPDSPHMLHAGDIVDLPPAISPSPTPPPSDADVYLVEPGDSYWRIAESRLRSELGRDPSGAEVLVRTHELIARNRHRLGEPDVPHMLHPGDLVHLTDTPVAPEVPVPPVTPSSDEVTATSPPPTPPVVATVQPAAEDTSVVPRPVVPTNRPDSTAPSPDPLRPPLDRPSTSAVTSTLSNDLESEGGAALGRLAGMSAVAAAGVASAWMIRRQRAARRARPHQRPAPIKPHDRSTISELMARDLDGVPWMAAELRLLAAQLPATARKDLTIQLVQFDHTGDLEVAFAEIPTSEPPDGWSAAAERVWRLDTRHSGEALDTVADSPPVAPALVTLGTDASGSLLLNLEAVPGVNVRGDEDLVAAWVRNTVWELAGAALAEQPTIVLVDIEITCSEQLAGVTELTAKAAAEFIEGEHPTRAGESSMLARRVAAGDAWPPTLVVLGAGASADQRWSSLASRPSVAVIAPHGALPGALDLGLVDGELHIPAWGLRLLAQTLDDSVAATAAEMLEAADDEPVPDNLRASARPPEPTIGDDVDVATEVDWEMPTWPVTVHLLGEPHATRDGDRLALSPQQLSVLAYLAVARDASIDEFNEAVWAGSEVKSARRRELLADLRKLVGGRSVIGHVEDGRIRAGVDLGSDLLVFEALNARAQEAPGEINARLHDMMELVGGQPFSYPSTASHLWRWVDHPEHLQALWGLRVSTVAWELAGIHIENNDASAARDVAERGLVADPLNSALTERLMEAYGAMHALEAVQRVYESHDRALTARGFDGASDETRRVLERLRAAHAAEAEAAVGP